MTKYCPHCPDHEHCRTTGCEWSREEALELIVSAALELCAQGRVLNGAAKDPPLWIQEHYDKELAAWETRAKRILSR